MLAELLLSEIRDPHPDRRQMIQTLISNDPFAIPTLIMLISESSLFPESDAFFISVLTFHHFHCNIPNVESLLMFVDFLDIPPPTRVLHYLSQVIVRQFNDTNSLFGVLTASPITSGRLFCLLMSARVHQDAIPEYRPYFIEAMCSPQIPIDQREGYAQVLWDLENPDGTHDWTPLLRVLEVPIPICETAKLLAILLRTEGVLAPASVRKQLLRLIPELQVLYTSAHPGSLQVEDNAISEALDGILRNAQPDFEEPWDEVEVREIFEACWALLNGPRKILESIDDFFTAYIDGDVDDDDGTLDDCCADFHSKICYVFANFPVMRMQVDERLATMPQFDLPAIRMIEYLNLHDDDTILRRIRFDSPDPVWRLSALSVVNARQVQIPTEIFHALFASQGWTDPLIGISLLRNMIKKNYPSPETLAGAVWRGIEIIGYFQTERVLQYLSILDQILIELLTDDAAREALVLVLPACINQAWEHLEGQSPRFFPRTAKLICRFIRYPEFVSFVDPLIMTPFFDLLARNRKRGFDFASKFVLSFPQYFERVDGAIEVLAAELTERLERGDWSVEVCDVALYFALNGQDGLAQVTVERLADGIPLTAPFHFVSLLIGLLQRSPNHFLLDVLMESDPMSIAGVAFMPIVALLYLTDKGVRDDHIAKVVHFCTRARGFTPSLVADRLILALLCRLLGDPRVQQNTDFRQEIYEMTMTILDQDALAGQDTATKPSNHFMKHRKLLCSELPWVFEDWNSFRGSLVQMVNLPHEIAGKLLSGLAQ
jgi:hypothetical protein